jgi:metacaspase-1
VILISGCQENQLSADGESNGLFTSQLLHTWNDGLFKGK